MKTTNLDRGSLMRREGLELMSALFAWRAALLGAVALALGAVTLTAAMTSGPGSSSATTDMLAGGGVLVLAWLFLRRR